MSATEANGYDSIPTASATPASVGDTANELQDGLACHELFAQSEGLTYK